MLSAFYLYRTLAELRRDANASYEAAVSYSSINTIRASYCIVRNDAYSAESSQTPPSLLYSNQTQAGQARKDARNPNFILHRYSSSTKPQAPSSNEATPHQPSSIKPYPLLHLTRMIKPPLKLRRGPAHSYTHTHRSEEHTSELQSHY